MNRKSQLNNQLNITSSQRVRIQFSMKKLILHVTFIVVCCCFCYHCSAQQVVGDQRQQHQQHHESELSIEQQANSHDLSIPTTTKRLPEKYYYYQQQNQKYQDYQQQQQQQQQQLQHNQQYLQQHQSQHYHQHAFSNNSIEGVHMSATSGRTKDHKKNSLAMQKHHSLNKLRKYLNQAQIELVDRHPGSMLAVARALKMAIIECQYQMRHEAWDCPIYGFSLRPSDIFGKLMSRSFRETSFIHALLSSAITHSVARACTESTIGTCGRLQTRDGGYAEDIGFGRQFAADFMNASLETTSSQVTTTTTTVSTNSIEKDLNNNIIGSGSSVGNEAQLQQHQQQATSGHVEPLKRERRIRTIINNHNDELGRLIVINGRARECKCHGLSGACNIHTCWVKLPPFREVANKLHEKYDKAVRLIYVAHNPIYRQKSLTSASVKKSNKKRSSVQPVNGPSRLSTSLSLNHQNSNTKLHPYVSNDLTSDTANFIGSRRRSSKREIDSQIDVNNAIETNSRTVAAKPLNHRDKTGTDSNSNINNRDFDNPMIQSSNKTVVKRRPIARSIGFSAPTFRPDKLDLLYYEESPDFCVPNELYNIKGTKGRQCSENSDDPNSCERLCCGRGYKTEVREDKYNCECQFKFCCQLDCNTCTRRKIIHKCL